MWVEDKDENENVGRWVEEGGENDPMTHVEGLMRKTAVDNLPGQKLVATPQKNAIDEKIDTIGNVISRIFRDPEKEKAKNANIVAMSQQLNIPFNHVDGYYNTLKEKMFESTDVNMQKAVKGVGVYAGAAALPFIMHGLWTAPLLTLGGLGFAEGVNEAISLTNHINRGKWKEYRPMKGAASAEDTEYGKDMMNLISMVGGLVGMVGGAKMIPKGKSMPELASLVTKRIVQEGGIPKKVWIDGAQVSEIISGRPNTMFKGGEKGSNWVPEEVIEFYKECGLSGAEARQAIKYGIDIEVSTDTVMKMVDRPYWEKLKSIIKMDPYQRVISTEKGGKVTYRIGDENGIVHKTPAGGVLGEVAGPDAGLVDITTPSPKAETQKITPAKVTGSITSEEGYAYHATSKDRLYDIADSGELKVNEPWDYTEQDMWPDGSTEMRSYFSSKADTTMAFTPDPSNPVIIRTKNTGIKTEKGTGDLYHTKPIPSSELEFLGDDGGWHSVDTLTDTTVQTSEAGTQPLGVSTGEGAVDAAPPAPAKAGGQAENATGTPPKLTLAIRDGDRVFVAERERIHGDLLARLVEDGKIEKAHAWEDLADSKSAMGWVDEEGNFYSKDEATRMMNGEAVMAEPVKKSIEQINAELDANYAKFMEDAGKVDIYDFVANRLESEGVSLGELYDAAKEVKGILDNLGAARKGFDKLIREHDKAVKLGKKVEERGELLAQKKAYDDALRIHKRIKTRIKELTGQQKVGNVVGEQEALKAAFKKAEQASKIAFREGNKEGAAKARAKAKDLAAMQKNREWLKTDIKRKIKSMKVMAGRKGIDADYRELIQSMMADYDLMIRSEKTLGRRQSTRDFIEREKALGNVIDIPERVMDVVYRKPVAEMTIDELYDLHDAVITLGKLGKLKSQLIAGVKARNFANVKWQIIEEVESRLGVPTVENGPLISVRETAWEKSMHIVRQISSEMVKMEYLVEKADNWKKDGPLYSNMFKPIVDGGLKKFKLEHATAERMKPVFELLKEEWVETLHGKMDIGEIGKPMVVTRENAIMIALNGGNEGNIRDLIEGNGLTRENVKNAWDRLKPNEQQFVREVWDVVGSFFQKLQKVMRDLTGNKMERVEGNYFPIITDAELSAQAKVRMADEDMFEITMLRAKVKNGMTMRRKPNAVAGPLNLTFDVIFRHVSDVINYISYAIPVRDAQKIVLDPEISGALIKRLGKENYDQMLPWIRDIANPRNPITGGERVLSALKNNAAVAMMGWSLSVSFLQPLAYTQTINRVGWGNAMSGLQDFYRNPIENVSFILENDVWMYERTKTLDRDLREFLQAKNMKDMFTDHSIRDSFFSIMTTTDRLATFPTWWTGYQMEMKISGDHEKAVEMGRKLVRETQGSGMTADTPRLMRRQALKIFTMFQSFFSSTYNEAWKDWHRAKDKDVSKGKLILSWWWLFAVPGAISSILYNYLKKGKVDGWGVAEGVVGYAAGSVPIAGSVVTSILEGWEYRPSPIVKLPSEVMKMKEAKTAGQLVEHGINASGFVFGLPARQTLLTADFVNELIKGNVEPGRLLYKPEKKKGKKSGYNY
jgi:hypothetical protein